MVADRLEVGRTIVASMTGTTLSHGVYAFPFGQRGLMVGLGLEVSKITRIQPGR